MANDRGWQRRTDEWVNSIHKSRLKKEQELLERNELLITKESTEGDNLSPPNEADTSSKTDKKISGNTDS
jgi:hypothetical protein